MRWTVDASAVIALLKREPVSATLLDAIEEGVFLAAANLVEVATWLARTGDADLAPAIARSTHAAVVPLTEELAIAAGRLEPITRPLGLSLADRCCLVTAAAFDAQALTTDRSWAQLPAPWNERVVVVRPD